MRLIDITPVMEAIDNLIFECGEGILGRYERLYPEGRQPKMGQKSVP